MAASPHPLARAALGSLLVCALAGCSLPQQRIPLVDPPGKPPPVAASAPAPPTTCLVDLTVPAEDFLPDAGVVLRHDDLTITHADRRLSWHLGEDSGELYVSPPLETPDPDGWDGDRINSTPQLSGDWVLFTTADSLWAGAEQQLYGWNLRTPSTPPVLIASAVGSFDARGPLVVWTTGTAADDITITLTDLENSTTRRLVTGTVHSPVLLDDDTVVWNAGRSDGPRWLAGIELAAGGDWHPPSEISAIDAWAVAGDGETLAIVSRDPDHTYSLRVWRPGWGEGVLLHSAEQWIWLDSDDVDGDLVSYSVSRPGAEAEDDYLVFNAATGVAHRYHKGWGWARFQDGNLLLSVAELGAAGHTASIDLNRFASAGC